MTRRALVLALLAFVFAAACGDSTAPTENVTGAYPLRTINGANLPYVETVGNTRFELVSETITLLDNGTFTVTGSVRLTEGTLTETENFNEQGTFTRIGTAITFVVPEQSSISGTLANDAITFSSDGLTYVFRK